MRSLYESITEAIDPRSNVKPGLEKFCYLLLRTAREVPVGPIIDIFGEKDPDYPKTQDSYLRCESGWFSDDPDRALVIGYLCYNVNGDYLPFINKPTNTQLNKAKVYIEKEIKKHLGPNRKLWDEYGTIFNVEIKGYNAYYQPPNTYGIGLKFKFLDEKNQ